MTFPSIKSEQEAFDFFSIPGNLEAYEKESESHANFIGICRLLGWLKRAEEHLKTLKQPAQSEPNKKTPDVLNILERLLEVPQQLTGIPRWITWSGDPKDKKPYISGTFDQASTSTPEHLASFDQAVRNIEDGRGYPHLGFVPQHPFVGLDLDSCRDPQTGSVQPWATEVLGMIGSTYVEVTPSQAGLRAWVKLPHVTQKKIYKINTELASVAGKASADQLAEHRKKDRERKAAKREQLRVEREKAEPMDFWTVCEQYFASPEYAEVTKYVSGTLEKIYEELQMEPLSTFHYVAEHMEIALTLHCAMDKNLQRQTEKGPVFGSYFADVAGQDIVRSRHQMDLTRSKTFSDIYWELLRKLDKMHGQNVNSKDHVYKACATAIRDELSGTYVYQPAVPVVKPRPKVDPPVPEPDTDLELQKVLDRQRQQLQDDLARYGRISQFTPPEAIRYLDGRR